MEREEKSEVAEESDILQRFGNELTQAGVAGRSREKKLLLVVATSRLRPKPLSAVVKAQSGAGKSFLVEQVVNFVPPTQSIIRTGMSPKVLAYTEQDLSHQLLVIAEAEGGLDADSYFLRSLLSEGKITYEVVTSKADGTFGTQVVERQGPVGLIVTTTRPRLYLDNETRMISIELDDSRSAQDEILRMKAGTHTPPDLGPWHDYQEWLRTAAEQRVVIPYRDALVDHVTEQPGDRPGRFLRDFERLLVIVETLAFMHQLSRSRDASGAVVADLQDYAWALELYEPYMVESLGLAVNPKVRVVVEEVEKLLNARGGYLTPVSQVELIQSLGWDKTTMSRTVRRAVEDGYLLNLEPEGYAKGYKLVLGLAMPGSSRSPLPTVEELEARLNQRARGENAA